MIRGKAVISAGRAALEARSSAQIRSLDHDPHYEAQPVDYWRLLKPRVMSLVVFTSLVGLLAAPAHVHPVIAFASILCVAVGAGASGALNMWWDADIDVHMERTKNRPVPAGRVKPEEALGFGLGLSVISVVLLAVFANPAAAALLAFTIAFYVVIYSMWLKRSTPYNIVIGGAAGAFPPMIGWTVATGGIAIEPILLFAIIFLWTPPHSWALALFRRDDYARVGVPMLPVAAGEVETRRQIVFYSVVLAPVAIAPIFTPIAGVVYGVTAVLLTAQFLRLVFKLNNRTEAQAKADKYQEEKKFFGFSILYLFSLFLALMIEAGLRAFGLA